MANFNHFDERAYLYEEQSWEGRSYIGEYTKEGTGILLGQRGDSEAHINDELCSRGRSDDGSFVTDDELELISIEESVRNVNKKRVSLDLDNVLEQVTIRDILLAIFKMLDIVALLKARLICKHFLKHTRFISSLMNVPLKNREHISRLLVIFPSLNHVDVNFESLASKGTFIKVERIQSETNKQFKASLENILIGNVNPPNIVSVSSKANSPGKVSVSKGNAPAKANPPSKANPPGEVNVSTISNPIDNIVLTGCFRFYGITSGSLIQVATKYLSDGNVERKIKLINEFGFGIYEGIQASKYQSAIIHTILAVKDNIMTCSDDCSMLFGAPSLFAESIHSIIINAPYNNKCSYVFTKGKSMGKECPTMCSNYKTVCASCSKKLKASNYQNKFDQLSYYKKIFSSKIPDNKQKLSIEDMKIFLLNMLKEIYPNLTSLSVLGQTSVMEKIL